MSETYDLPGLEPGPADAVQEPSDSSDLSDLSDLSESAVPARQDAPVAETERAPEPLGVIVGPTGNAEVDAAVERLSDADALPTDAHIEVYEDVHRGLRDTLTALDENRG